MFTVFVKYGVLKWFIHLGWRTTR